MRQAQYARLYPDETGESHLEDLETSLAPVNFTPLAGPVNIAIASDGAVCRFRPGGVILMENTRGKGHGSRVIGNREILFFEVALDVGRACVFRSSASGSATGSATGSAGAAVGSETGSAAAATSGICTSSRIRGAERSDPPPTA